ncbi:hypothetical protein Tco_0182066 [Tanacetum coccineum]
MSHFQAFYGRLPLSLIPYPPGSSKVVVVEELLVKHDGLMWHLKQNLVEAKNIMEVKANRIRRDVEFNLGDKYKQDSSGFSCVDSQALFKEALTKLLEEFQEGQPLEKPKAICDSRLV